MLRKDGLAFFEIPNRNFPKSIESDGHYSLPYITLLNRIDAENYFLHFYPEKNYAVEFYLSIEEYKSIFNKYGLSFEIISQTYFISPEETITDIKNLELNIERKTTEIKDIYFSNTIKTLFYNYINTATEVFNNNKEKFKIEYCASLWSIIARKEN